MDPASIVGITAGSLSLLKLLLEGSMGLQTALREIKNIDDNTENLAAEIAAFDSILQIFNVEIRDGQFLRYVNRWWDADRLEGLLSNAVRTYSHLDVIIKDVVKQRSVLVAVRQYWTSKKYDKEIGHLRLRINTYIKALQIPIELGRIHNINASVAPQIQGNAQFNRTQRDVDVLANQVLGDRVGRLEESIDSLSQGISNLLDSRDQLWSTPIQRESGELVAVVQTLAASASNASVISGGALSIGAPTVIYRPGQPSASGKEERSGAYSPSIHGVPMTHQARQSVNSWMNSISSTASVSDISVATSNLSLSSDIKSTRYTAPSTVHGRRDIRVELVERRYKQAMRLMSEKKYQEAIPHLKRSLAELNNNPEYAKAINLGEGGHGLTLSLAKSLIKSEIKLQKLLKKPPTQPGYPGYVQQQPTGFTAQYARQTFPITNSYKNPSPKKTPDPFSDEKLDVHLVSADGPCGEAYTLLTLAVYDDETATSRVERAEAAYLLALSMVTYTKASRPGAPIPPEFDEALLTNAKKFCEEAAQWQSNTLGRDDPMTYKSIALLVKICRIQKDSDADLWMEMLPESYHSKLSTGTTGNIPNASHHNPFGNYPPPNPLESTQLPIKPHSESIYHHPHHQ